MRLLQQHPVRSLLWFAALGWGVLAVVLLAWPSAPTVQVLGGAGQHLVIGLALSLVGGGALAALAKWSGPTVGWVALAATTFLLFLLELVQMPVPGRSFQWEDLSFGAFGAVIGGAIVTVGTLLRRQEFARAVAGGGGVMLLVAVVAVVVAGTDSLNSPPTELVANCEGEPVANVDWSLVVIDFAVRDGDCIETMVGPLAAFGESLTDEPAALDLTGGGVASGALDGLAAAIVESGQVTFGVRFTAGEVGEVGPPIVLARLIIDDDPSWPLAQILQRGPHIASNTGSGRPTVGVGSVLADTLEAGVVHEYVVTYSDGEAITYLDGLPVARSSVPPMRFEIDAPLSLEIGWRTDENWEPFIGMIDGVVVANRALTADEVQGAFTPG